MLTRIEVKGFKTLADVAVDLGAVNVFIGANGSGKSNLLEAVGILSTLMAGGPEPEAFRYRGIRQGTPASFLTSFRSGEPTAMSITVSNERVDYMVAVGPDVSNPSKWSIIEESFWFDTLEVLKRTEAGFHAATRGTKWPFQIKMSNPTASIVGSAFPLYAFRPNADEELSDPNSAYNSVLRFAEEVKAYAIYTPNTAQLRGFVEDIQRQPLGLGGSGLGRAIEQMSADDSSMFGPYELDEVFDLIDWADDLSVGPTEQEYGSSQIHKIRIGDRFMTGFHKSVSATEASEGALYVLFLLALSGHDEAPRMFAVDNFDQALHPRLARALTRMICDQIGRDGTRQMLATTHNPLVLDGLNLLDDRIRLFTVDRDSHGATQIKRVTVSKDLMAQAENGMSLSRLWTMGRLGGVPKYLF